MVSSLCNEEGQRSLALKIPKREGRYLRRRQAGEPACPVVESGRAVGLGGGGVAKVGG